MAHGFLTPTPVTGESPIAKYLQKKIEDKIEKESKKLWDKTKSGLSDLYKKLTKAKTTYRGKGVGRVDVTGPKDPVAGGMLPGIKPKGLLSASNTSLAKKDSGSIDKPEIDPVSGNRLPPSGGPTTPGGGKGGSFVDIGGSQAKPLNAENFFSKAVNEGIDVNTGEYLSKEARIAAFQAGKVERSQSEGPAISADSGVDIVAAVNRNTQMIVSLVDAVKTQTSNDSKISQDQIQSQRQLMMKSAAAQEEAAMEQGNDLSGFMTPENFAKRKKNEKKKEENDKGSKLKEFFKGPNPYKQPEACGCSPILGGPPGGGGGFGGIGVPDFVDQKRKTMGRPSRLGGGASAMRRGGGARGLTRIATKVGGKGAGKAVAKGLGKGLLKKIPGVGVLAGGAFAAERAMKGDWLGAGGELLSGVASLIPGIGTAVSTGIDAGLMARDAGLTPFAAGGIVTNPVAGLVGEAGNEGIFPLEGSRGKKTFQMFGEGMLNAQLDNDDDFAKLQSKGLKQYYEREGGFKKMGEGLKDFFSSLAGGIAALLGGPARAGTLDDAADYLDGGGDFSGSDGQAQAMNYFMSQGLSKEQAAGIVGNLMQESGAGLDPNAKNKTGHRGIAQWDANRWGNFEKWAKKKGLDVNTREAQLQWIMEEMRTGDGGLGIQRFKATKTAEEAAALFVKDYERSGEKPGQAGYDNRIKNAKALAAKTDFGSTAGGGSSGAGGLTKGAGTFIQGDTGRSRGPHFHIGPDEYRLGGKRTEQGKKDAREAAFKVAKGLMAKGVPFYFSNLAGFGLTKPWFKGKGDKKTDEQLRNAIAGEQHGHATRPGGGSWGGIDIAAAGGTKLPVGVGPVKDRGDGFGNAATIMGTRGFVGHGASGSRATKANELVAVNPAPAPEGVSPLPASPAGQGGRRSATGSTPGSLQASAANANDGTTMMATSQQVAMGTMGLTTGGGTPTIINNYYGGGGQQGGVNSNAVFPGIGMEQTGTTVFQELKMRALA